MLLICSAWENEINKLKSKLESRSTVVETLGIGYLNTALNLQKLISENSSIDQIMFLGTAGVYQKTPKEPEESSTTQEPISEIVAVNSVSLIHHGETAGVSYVPKNLSKDIFYNSQTAKSFNSLPEAHCYSSLEITKDERMYKKLLESNQDFAKKLIVENMELFGIAKVAHENQIPWSSYLVIANKIYNNAHQEWLQNHQKCSDKLCDYICKNLESSSIA